MDNAFDEAYARYLRFLAKLDTVDDVAEKNLLFRQLAQQLSDLEHRLKAGSRKLTHEEPLFDDQELTC